MKEIPNHDNLTYILLTIPLPMVDIAMKILYGVAVVWAIILRYDDTKRKVETLHNGDWQKYILYLFPFLSKFKRK